MAEELIIEKKKDEVNPLLDEIRASVGPSIVSGQNIKDAISNSSLDDSKKEEIKKALDDLKRKMVEIDEIIVALKKREVMEKNNPKRTEKLLTEIKVPSLEMLK